MFGKTFGKGRPLVLTRTTVLAVKVTPEMKLALMAIGKARYPGLWSMSGVIRRLVLDVGAEIPPKTPKDPAIEQGEPQGPDDFDLVPGAQMDAKQSGVV
jgi:hypothetical protein